MQSKTKGSRVMGFLVSKVWARGASLKRWHLNRNFNKVRKEVLHIS